MQEDFLFECRRLFSWGAAECWHHLMSQSSSNALRNPSYLIVGKNSSAVFLFMNLPWLCDNIHACQTADKGTTLQHLIFYFFLICLSLLQRENVCDKNTLETYNASLNTLHWSVDRICCICRFIKDYCSTFTCNVHLNTQSTAALLAFSSRTSPPLLPPHTTRLFLPHQTSLALHEKSFSLPVKMLNGLWFAAPLALWSFDDLVMLKKCKEAHLKREDK